MKGLAERWKMMAEEDKEVDLRLCVDNIHCEEKNTVAVLSSVFLPNIGQFQKFFRWYTQPRNLQYSCHYGFHRTFNVCVS